MKVAAVAIAALGAAAIKFGKDFLAAFAVQEEAVQSLAAALEATGRGGVQNLKLITDQAAALQRLTTKGDEAIIAATSSLAQLATEVPVSQLAAAQKAIIGIADTFAKGDGGRDRLTTTEARTDHGAIQQAL
jgi:hypothetical protein